MSRFTWHSNEPWPEHDSLPGLVRLSVELGRGGYRDADNEDKGNDMTITASIVVGCLVGLVLGNFTYQVFTGQYAWAVAADRSYFQVIAVGGLMLVGWLLDAPKGGPRWAVGRTSRRSGRR